MKIRHNSMIGGDDDGADAAPALMCKPCTPPDLQMPPTLKEAQIALDRTPLRSQGRLATVSDSEIKHCAIAPTQNLIEASVPLSTCIMDFSAWLFWEASAYWFWAQGLLQLPRFLPVDHKPPNRAAWFKLNENEMSGKMIAAVQ